MPSQIQDKHDEILLRHKYLQLITRKQKFIQQNQKVKSVDLNCGMGIYAVFPHNQLGFMIIVEADDLKDYYPRLIQKFQTPRIRKIATISSTRRNLKKQFRRHLDMVPRSYRELGINRSGKTQLALPLTHDNLIRIEMRCRDLNRDQEKPEFPFHLLIPRNYEGYQRDMNQKSFHQTMQELRLGQV